jgi:hypothetical protein
MARSKVSKSRNGQQSLETGGLQKEAPVATNPTNAPQADILVEGGGSLFVFRILSESARTWVEESVSREGFQPDFPDTLYVEHRYARDLAAGMQACGLAVR